MHWDTTIIFFNICLVYINGSLSWASNQGKAYDFKNVHFCMLAFLMCETEERDVDKLTSRIKSKPKLIQTFRTEMRREALRSWAGVREKHLISYCQVVKSSSTYIYHWKLAWFLELMVALWKDARDVFQFFWHLKLIIVRPTHLNSSAPNLKIVIKLFC